MQYFAHESRARQDAKIRLLRHQFTGAAVDCYWAVIELIYEREGQIDFKDESLVFGLCLDLETDEQQLLKWVDAMIDIGLLFSENDIVSSTRASASISAYQKKCERNRKNINKRWQKERQENKTRSDPVKQTTEIRPYYENDTTVKRSKNEGTDNKNKKEREIKIKEKEKEKTASSSQQIPSEIWKGEDTDGFAKFLKDALCAFNVETKARLPDFDAKTHINLRKIFDHGRTIEDLVLVIRSKRKEWESNKQMKRYIRPSTLFGARFEEYLMAAQAEKSERGEYACYN